ncbi:hypothetical protein AgCh_040088 [Apium graveolens]
MQWTNGFPTKVFFALTMAATGISQSGSFVTDKSKASTATTSIFSILDRKSKIDPCDESEMILENVKGNIELQNINVLLLLAEIHKRDAFEWDAVENGFTILTKEGKPKSLKDLSPEEVNAMNSNAKAMNSLLNGMVATKLRKVSACTTAKQIWDTIKVSHEGTSKVREVKLSMLMSDYECFRLERDESVRDAQGRFLTFMNSISLLERIIPQSEIGRKILRAMPKKFAPKVTILQDSTLLSTMDTLTLLSELEKFENQLRRYDEEDKAPRKKTLALNADADESPDDSDEEIALLTKKFHKFLAKRNASK